jgi:hypothetical protein
VLILSAAIGAWTLFRRWPWLLVIIVTGWVSVLMAGVATGAPVTPVRVMLGFYALVFVVIVFGFFEGARRVGAWIAGRASIPQMQQVAVGALAVLTIVALWPPAGETKYVFARGMDRDLDVVANSPSDDNLVLVYHDMAGFYAHERLANQVEDASRFTLVREMQGDRTLYDDPDTYIRRYLPRGGVVWCVITWYIGPKNFGRACEFERDDLTPIEQVSTFNALIMSYRVPS